MDLKIQQHDDHEAKMARAELYENEELDGWVQSKITKAADYISSVYHYLEYEKMAGEAVEHGPREFEESIEHQVKNDLKEQWLKKKQGN